MTVSIGADPEFFKYDSSDYNNPMGPSIGIVPGTKEDPQPLGEEGSGLFAHEDNVCIEIGIPPTNNASVFSQNIMAAMELVRTTYLPAGQSLYCTASWDFAKNQLKSKQAKSFGCEPDFDAYTGGKVRTVPSDIMDGTTRYAGGHVHIGGDFNCPPFIAALFADIFLTLVPLGQGEIPQDSRESMRKLYYGKPGVFREKSYGIEYRTPSNYWCSGATRINMMGRRALSLGAFLENTSATELRNIVKQYDWLALQTCLSIPQSSSSKRISSCNELTSAARALGVPV